MQSAKISLSPQHIKLVTNAQWILTKNEILQHIKNSFEALQEWQRTILKDTRSPLDQQQYNGKISRGENYLGLPWIVLDHPRHFIKGNIFAIRTLFWWGQYFSITLHLSGAWQQKLAPLLMQALSQLQKDGWLLSYDGDEWVHDLKSASYIPFNNLSPENFVEITSKAPFIKIAASIDIEKITDATELLMARFQFLIEIITSE